MYLTGTLATEQQGWDIWMATAPGLDGPWTRSEEPVLRRGEAGAWDAGGLDFPTVIGDAEVGYTMFYSGIPTTETDTGSVGRATSTDGIEWTKDEEPVVEPGLCGGFDERAIHQPRVVVERRGSPDAVRGLRGRHDHAAVASGSPAASTAAPPGPASGRPRPSTRPA